MAQPKLDAISVKLSKRIGDEVSSASADGVGGISAAMRLEAINDARNTLYLSRLMDFGIDKFIEIFPEFVQSVVLSCDVSLKFPLDNFIKAVLAAELHRDVAGGIHLLNFIDAKHFLDAAKNPYSTFKPSSTYEVYSVFDNALHVLPVPATDDDTLTSMCVIQPIAVVQGGANADIFEPENWVNDITMAAFKVLLTNLQKVNS